MRELFIITCSEDHFPRLVNGSSACLTSGPRPSIPAPSHGCLAHVPDTRLSAASPTLPCTSTTGQVHTHTRAK